MKKYLLDTHTFLWFMEDSKFLSKNANSKIINGEIYLSIISLWEIAIKINIGKLELNFSLEKYENSWKKIGGKLLNISTNHIFNYENLELHHRDPFDRMLIAQAKVENLIVITKDRNFK